MKMMIRENCDGCIWQGCCEFTAPCDFFTPSDEMNDAEVDYLIEINRDRFRREFAAYLRVQEE